MDFEECWLDLSGSGLGTFDVSSKYGNEPDFLQRQIISWANVLLSALYLPHGMLSDLMTLLHVQSYIVENKCMIFMMDWAGFFFFSKVTFAILIHRYELPPSRRSCQVPPKPYSHLTARCYIPSLPALKYTVVGACEGNSKYLNIFLVETFPFLVLTFQSLKLILCTKSFTIQKFCVLPTMRLCALCVSQNKQRLFPYTALTYWF